MPKQFEIHPHTAQAYLNKLLPKLRGSINRFIDIQPVEGGNANYVYRVTAQTPKGESVVYLRQAQAFNKRARDVGKLIRVSPVRIYGEYRMLRYLKNIWGKGIVPDVLYFDRANHVLLLSDVGSNSALLYNEFVKGKVHPEIAKPLARLLAILHAESFNTRKEFSGSRAWKRQLFKNLVVKHWSIALTKYESKKVVEKFFEESKKVIHCGLWADPVYKNIFVKPSGVTLIDFDHTMTYDPAFELGILLSHWTWMMLKGNKNLRRDSQRFIKNFVTNYENEFFCRRSVSSKLMQQLWRRTRRWLGFYLVTRTDGKSGSYFAHDPAWENRIRSIGLALFTENNKVKEVQVIKKLMKTA